MSEFNYLHGSYVWVTLRSYQVLLQKGLQPQPVEGYKQNWGHVGQKKGPSEVVRDYSF